MYTLPVIIFQRVSGDICGKGKGLDSPDASTATPVGHKDALVAAILSPL